MAIIVVTWYKIGRLAGFGVKHVKFSYFLSIALTIGLSVFYILYYIYLLTGFPFTCFPFPITILLGIPLSNAINESVSLASLLAL